MNEPDLFSSLNHRATDPATSSMAARSLTAASSNRASLLEAYRRAGNAGLTDEQAATAAGLDATAGYWKRCSDLRRLGLISATGEIRNQESGRAAMVCAITENHHAVP